MFYLFQFLLTCMLALAAAEPKPEPSVVYSSYPAAVAAAYAAPAAAYSAYPAPLAAYSAYPAPVAAYSAYSYASPYSFYAYRR